MSGGNQTLPAVFGLVFAVIGSLTLLRVMKYWGDKYILGWLLGAAVLVWLGFLNLSNTLDVLVYLLVPVLILVSRMFHK